MPAVAARTLTFTPEDYVAWEAEQPERHEYHFGEVFPMPCGTSTHAELIVALSALMYVALRGTECTVRSEAMRFEISDDQYVYPDLTVTCGAPAFRSSTRTTLLNPTLVAEVLASPTSRFSPSTRSYDVGDKFSLYRVVASVQEVLFVGSERRRVETARRTDAGWVLSGPVETGTVRLDAVGVDVDLAALYDGIV